MAWIQTSSGIALPEPLLGSGNTTISTMVNSGRNASGNFVGQVVGEDKMKIEMSFEGLSPQEFRNLLKIWDRRQGGKFINTFTVYDPRVMDYVSMKMYVGDRQGRPVMVSNPGTGDPRFWQDIKVDLIQV